MDLLDIIARLVVILMHPTEVEDARHTLPREVVMVTAVVEPIRVILPIEGLIQLQARVKHVRLTIDRM